MNRSNDLLGRAGSNAQLEALLNDVPTKDAYGRQIIAEKSGTSAYETMSSDFNSSYKPSPSLGTPLASQLEAGTLLLCQPYF